MINLHQRYNHYLHSTRILNDHDVNERVIAYGWTDDGKSITGFYVLTETKKLLYTTKGELLSIEDRVEEKAAA
mgnify:FL=1|jgi:hypothetical protein|tara:strand:- start:457 stop:675 length:219 start_codon:yes stop_codon:yes gene_type:complete